MLLLYSQGDVSKKQNFQVREIIKEAAGLDGVDHVILDNSQIQQNAHNPNHHDQCSGRQSKKIGAFNKCENWFEHEKFFFMILSLQEYHRG